MQNPCKSIHSSSENILDINFIERETSSLVILIYSKNWRPKTARLLNCIQLFASEFLTHLTSCIFVAAWQLKKLISSRPCSCWLLDMKGLWYHWKISAVWTARKSFLLKAVTWSASINLEIRKSNLFIFWSPSRKVSSVLFTILGSRFCSITVTIHWR